MKTYVVETEKLVDNIHILQKKAESVPIWGVVKGNGYGFGIVPMAEILREEGITRFAVTAAEEALSLRRNGFEAEEILMLRAHQDTEELEKLIAANIICTVGSLDQAQAVETVALHLGKIARVHVKIDTGMGRYGFLPGEYERIERVYRDYPHLNPEGIFTHFHTAGNETVTRSQFQDFRQVLEKLKCAGINPGMAHCCNSLAFWYYPEMHMDAVRLGSCILGRIGYAAKAGLHRIGYAEATVEEVRVLPKGHNVG